MPLATRDRKHEILSTFRRRGSRTRYPEPFAYQSGFSVKWLIEEQLAGSAALNFDPAKGSVMAPWLSWGSYLWADGLVPRSDGLTWACGDFRDTDGTHPSDLGRAKVASLLLDFFKSDPTTARWFVDCFPSDPGTFAAPPEAQDLQVADGGGGSVTISWDSLYPVVGPGVSYDLVTGSVSQLRSDNGFAGAGCLTTGLPDTPFTDSRSGPAPGEAFYYLARGRNGCGVGTYGDGTPSPRSWGSPGRRHSFLLLIALQPASCIPRMGSRTIRRPARQARSAQSAMPSTTPSVRRDGAAYQEERSRVSGI